MSGSTTNSVISRANKHLRCCRAARTPCHDVQYLRNAHKSCSLQIHMLAYAPGQQGAINLCKLAPPQVQVIPASPKDVQFDFSIIPHSLRTAAPCVAICAVQVLHLRRHKCQRWRTSPSVCPLPSSTVITLFMRYSGRRTRKSTCEPESTAWGKCHMPDSKQKQHMKCTA